MAGIERQQFRPTASPVSTFGVQTRWAEAPKPVAPVKPLAPNEPDRPTPPPRGSSSLMQLGEALSALSPRVASAFDQYFKGQQTEEANEADLIAQQNNDLSWADAVRRDPTLADRSPYFRQIYEGRTTKTRINKRATELMAEYYTSEIANSEDPTAVNSWLQERLKDTLKDVKSPAEMAAAREELERVAAQFMGAHKENARRNLINKNVNSAFDDFNTELDQTAIKGTAAAYRTDDPVIAANLDSSDPRAKMKAAFLNGIAGGESAGKYNIRYTPSGGALFDLNGQHPRIFEPTADGQKSSAAGRYQFTWTTWNALTGGEVPFTPENQDKAAILLAEKDYEARTGRNLWDDMEKEGFSPRIQKTLAPTWQALRGNHGRHQATYNESLRKYGAEPSGLGAQNGYLPELMESIHAKEAQLRGQGINGDTINQITVKMVTEAAIRHGDPQYLDILLQPRPDGTPGAGFGKYRSEVEQAAQTILANRIKLDEHEAKIEERKRKLIIRKEEAGIMEKLVGQMGAGEMPRIDNAEIMRLNAIDPDLGKKAVELSKSMNDLDKTEDPSVVSAFGADVYGGRATTQDVFNWAVSRQIKDPTTIRNFFEEARRNENSDVMTKTIVSSSIREIEQLVGEPDFNGLPRNTNKSVSALTEFRRSIFDYAEKNPGDTSSGKFFNYVIEQRDLVLKNWAPPDKQLDAAKPNAPTPESAVTAPKKAGAAKAPTPSQQAAPEPVQPGPGRDYQKEALFPDRATLEGEIQKVRDGKPNLLAGWVKQNPGSTYKEIIEAQRALLK